MKKTILAAIIPALLMGASSSALAYDIVKTDDITINMNGDIDLKIWYVDNELKDDADTTIKANFDDLDFTFKYKINEGLTFIAETDWTSEATEGNKKSSDGEDTGYIYNAGAWIGFKTDYGTLRGGFQETSIDPLGIDNSEIVSVGMASGDVDGDGTTHAQSLRYDYTVGDLWLSATYGSTGADKEEPLLYAAAFQYTPGNLRVEGGLGQVTTYDDGKKDQKAEFIQAQIEYTMSGLTGGLLVSASNNDVIDSDILGVELDVSYMLTKKLRLAAGYENISQDVADESNDLNNWYVGTRYKFSKYVIIYTEIGQKDGELQKFGSTSASEYDETYAGLTANLQF